MIISTWQVLFCPIFMVILATIILIIVVILAQ